MIFVTLAGGLFSSACLSYTTVPVDASIKKTQGALTCGPSACSFPGSSPASTGAAREAAPCPQSRKASNTAAIFFIFALSFACFVC